MTTCDSSLLSAYEYSDESWVLTVVFRSNGNVRHYADVPPEVYAEMVAAKSIGSFYNQKIKGKFEGTAGGKVTDEQVAEAVAEAAPNPNRYGEALKNYVETGSPFPGEEPVAPTGRDEDELGITDEDIQAVDPAYKPKTYIPHPEGTWHGVPLPPDKGGEPAEELAAQPEILSPDQAVAVLSPKNPQADKLTTELHKIAAVKIVVKDAASQAEMETHLVKLTQIRKAVFDIIDPYREIAYRAYEAVQKLNKARLDPADAAIKDGKQVLGVYLAAEQEKARVEQRRLQAEAEAEAAREQARQTEALRLQVASEHQERGDTAAAEASLFDETIQAAPVQVYAPRAEAPTSSLGGRANWKGEITDMDEVILDAAEGIKSLRAGKGLMGHVPSTVLQANDPGIKALANANKTMFRFPGMRAWDDRVITTTKKKGS